MYFNYGMYWLFNVVTEARGIPGAVLFRAIEPVRGIERMRRFRPRVKSDSELGNGPGKLALALNIGPEFNAQPLSESKTLYLAYSEIRVPPRKIVAGPRVGISQPKDLPWRFRLLDEATVRPSTGSRRSRSS